MLLLIVACWTSLRNQKVIPVFRDISDPDITEVESAATTLGKVNFFKLGPHLPASWSVSHTARIGQKLQVQLD